MCGARGRLGHNMWIIQFANVQTPATVKRGEGLV